MAVYAERRYARAPEVIYVPTAAGESQPYQTESDLCP